MTMLRILCFHRVVLTPQPFDRAYLQRGSAVTVDRFREILDQVAATHRLVDEDEATRILQTGKDAERTCWVTFDDGYRDVLEHALPELERRGILPSIFVTTQTLDGAWRFPVDRWYAAVLGATRHEVELTSFGSPPRAVDLRHVDGWASLVDGPEKQRFIFESAEEQARMLAVLEIALGSRPAPSPPLLSRSDLETLAQRGWRIGAHGRTHRVLAGASEHDLDAEVAGSLHDIAHFGRARSGWFAWPDGQSCSLSRGWLHQHAEGLRLAGGLGLAGGDGGLSAIPRVFAR